MGLGKYFFNPNDAGADSTEHLLNNSFSMKMDAGWISPLPTLKQHQGAQRY